MLRLLVGESDLLIDAGSGLSAAVGNSRTNHASGRTGKVLLASHLAENALVLSEVLIAVHTRNPQAVQPSHLLLLVGLPGFDPGTS